ncbi:hypothetical protein FMUND_2589 [Fusarium mundagurra]|uniref:Ankyrin repeat protein n=1 Tax=Fusarium mundagurra TaxID=1567541 RepID=A0A8H6DPE3_9HYPO|nr:hypothetical protein FMUND_2589 [Fusarium mundagurra]
MADVAALSSLELLSALREKRVVDLDVSNAETTPMHHLSATCTPEFARFLAELWDPFCADSSGIFPFQLFFERWLRDVRFNETIPLDPELLGVLIPKNKEFTSAVVVASKINISLQTVDDSYHFFNLALSRASPEVIVKLIDLGVDVHRRVPEDMSSSPMSLFEMACEEASIEPFKAILETVTSQSTNAVGLSVQSPLELVVKGSIPDKISLIKALDEKRLVQAPTTPATPLIIEAAKQDDLLLTKCLSDIGHDPFAVEVHDWGIPQWASNIGQLDILKWIVEKSASPSQ